MKPTGMEPTESVVMYSGEPCPYCTYAKRLLQQKGVAYREIRIDLSPELRAEMEQRSQRRTIPQIFINGQHVGGYDDLAALDKAGKLDILLAATTAV